MTWYPNGTTSISDDRGQEFVMHIPLDKANFALLSSDNTIVQRVVGEDYQYDVYWVPFENEGRIVDKYKFTIIGSSKDGLEVKFSVDTDKEIVSDGNRFMVTEKAPATDLVNSTSILSNATGILNSTASLDSLANETSAASVEGLGLDWSDAKAAGFDMKFDPASLQLSVQVGTEFSVDPTTVSSINTAVSPLSGDYYEGQRRIVAINNTIFAFFYDTSNIVYKYSADGGNTWSASTLSTGTGQISSDFNHWTLASTDYNGSKRITLLYYAEVASNTTFFAMRGTVNGTDVSWDSESSLFSVVTPSGGARATAAAATDSTGEMFSAFRWLSGSNYFYRILNSTDGGLNWSTSLGNTNSGFSFRITPTLTMLSSGKMLFVYGTGAIGDMFYRVYSGTSWGGLNTLDGTTEGIGWNTNIAKQVASDSLSDGTAYVSYVTVGTTGSLKAAKWNNAGAFQGIETADSATTHSLASISVTSDDVVHVYSSSNSKIVETKKVAATWQTTEFPFGTVSNSPNQLTSAIRYPSALWVESGNDLRFGTAVPADFEASELIPVQAIFNHDVLVEQKATVFRLDVDSTFSTTINNVKITLAFGSPEAGNTTLDEFVSIAPGSNSFYLPSLGVIFPSGSNFSATAQIDFDDAYSESDEGNNMISATTLPIKDTKPLFVLYRPVQLPDDEFPVCSIVSEFSEHNTDYVTAVYPVSEQESTGQVVCAPFQPVGHTGGLVTKFFWASINRQLDSLKTLSGADKVIGVVKGGWFAEETFFTPEGTHAAAMPGVDGIIVEEQLQSGPTVAHELAHTYNWVTPNHALEDPDHLLPFMTSQHFILFKAPGYWVAKKCEMGWYNIHPEDPRCIPETQIPLSSTEFSPFEFMYKSNINDFSGGADDVDAWISNYTYNFLLNEMKLDPADPPVIAVSGIIFENDTTLLSPWYRLNSTFDIDLNNTGEFRILYKNALNQTTAETGFDLNFDGFEEQGEDLGLAVVSFRIPDLAGTSKIVVTHENQTLAERVVTLLGPTVNVTSPNGGDTFTHGQNINVTWESSDLDGGNLTHVVSISQDGGLSWIALAAEIVGNNYSFVATPEIVSDEVLFKVLATDGINTGEDVSDATSTITGPISVDMFLHATGPTANPTNLFLNSTAPTATTTKYKDSASIKFAGGNQWKLIGQWPTSSPPSEGTLTDLGNLTVWLGLKNSDDIGTRFDLRAELYRDNELVASGNTHCITGVVRNPANAKEVDVSFGAFAPEEFDGTDDLSVKILTRIGSNPDDTFCGGHSNATGLRLYFDAASRPSMFNATFT